MQSHERIRECPDCKRKESKLGDQEIRIKELNDYIKKNSDKKKLEDEVTKLN